MLTAREVQLQSNPECLGTMKRESHKIVFVLQRAEAVKSPSLLPEELAHSQLYIFSKSPLTLCI
jgi:hypothetical protein